MSGLVHAEGMFIAASCRTIVGVARAFSARVATVSSTVSGSRKAGRRKLSRVMYRVTQALQNQVHSRNGWSRSM